MRRTNLAREFSRLQLESQRALRVLGGIMDELAPKRVDLRRRSRFSRSVQRLPVITYSRKA
jgi:hypothetical protein